MSTRERMSMMARSWGMTVLALLAASLILAAGSICMAERLVEMSLNREYVRYMYVQERENGMKLPYNDGIHGRSAANLQASECPADSV
ncbi:MAG: hypothetical protein MR966_02285 [Lachnospiraceae bacterium]|nr:hypothetical protein [Lachnospiraceae bacterium]